MKCEVYQQSFSNKILDITVSDFCPPMYVTFACRDCGGTGEFQITPSDYQQCNLCKGHGKEFISIY